MDRSAETEWFVDVWLIGSSVVSICQTLLDLGASPNYKDERGLTPLYHAVTKDSQAGPQCVQMLLYNRSDIGVVDDSWNTELHQVSNDLINSKSTHSSSSDLYITPPCHILAPLA